MTRRPPVPAPDAFKSGTRRVVAPDAWKPVPLCRHPEHGPPRYIVLKPGRYEHTCPGCGGKVRFTVEGVRQ